MLIDDNKVPLDENKKASIISPITKKFVDIFEKLKCKHCGTHLNGGTVCPNCGKAK